MPLARHLPLALAALLVTAGCGGDAAPDDAVANPSSIEDCNHPGGSHADGAGFGGAALHWSPRSHGADEPGEIFVCVRPGTPGSIKVLAPPGVEASPARVAVGGSGPGVTRVAITVTPGASGVIETSVSLGAGGTTLRGPEVVSDEEGWSFREPE